MDATGYEGMGRGPTPVQGRIERIENNPSFDRLADRLQRTLRDAFGRPRGRQVQHFLQGAWLGHPLHAAISDLPIGAWTTAGIFDLLSALRIAKLDKAAEAAIWVGIVGAAGAAAAGVADWTETRDEQRRVGMAHAGLNTVALLLYLASVRGRGRRRLGARSLAFLGLATVMTSAHLGGHLVYSLATRVETPSEADRLRRTTH